MKIISKILAALLAIVLIFAELTGYLIVEADTAVNDKNITAYFEQNTLRDLFDNEKNKDIYDNIKASLQYWGGTDDEMSDRILDSRTMSHITADVVSEVVAYARKDVRRRLTREHVSEILDKRFPEFETEGIKLMNYHQHFLRNFFYENLSGEDCALTPVYNALDEINGKGLCRLGFINVLGEAFVAVAIVCLLIGLLIALVRLSFYKAAFICGGVTIFCAIFPFLSFMGAISNDLFANQTARAVLHVINGAEKKSVLIWAIVGLVCGLLLIIWGFIMRKRRKTKELAKLARKNASEPKLAEPVKAAETAAVEETEEEQPEETTEPEEPRDVVAEAFNGIEEQVREVHESMGGTDMNTQNVLHEFNTAVAQKADEIESEVSDVQQEVAGVDMNTQNVIHEFNPNAEPETTEEPVEEPAEEVTEEAVEEISEGNNTQICPKCGREVEGEARFCRFCGQDLQAEVKLTCPNCGHEYEKGMKFCGRCGQRLPE